MSLGKEELIPISLATWVDSAVNLWGGSQHGRELILGQNVQDEIWDCLRKAFESES